MARRGDAELLRAWAAGDTKAGNDLFDRHFLSVKRFFARKVGEDVEDLVQQTFMGCLEGLPRFREASTFRTYLFGVARNILREHIRLKLRLSTDADVDEACAVELGDGPSTLLSLKQEKRLLLEALRRLPLDTQILLELAYWEKLRSREIGEVLGINENTARSRLRRSRELLEAALAEATRDDTALRTTMANLDSWAAALRARIASDSQPPDSPPPDSESGLNSDTNSSPGPSSEVGPSSESDG